MSSSFTYYRDMYCRFNAHRHWHRSTSGRGSFDHDGSELSAINEVVMPGKTSAVEMKAERRWQNAVTHKSREYSTESLMIRDTTESTLWYLY
jgi:hypothetical protein